VVLLRKQLIHKIPHAPRKLVQVLSVLHQSQTDHLRRAEVDVLALLLEEGQQLVHELVHREAMVHLRIVEGVVVRKENT
jgi:hypothetical protein